MLLLAVDTSTATVTAGSVLMLRPNELLEQREAQRPAQPVRVLSEHSVTDSFAHAEKLMPLINAALAGGGSTLSEVEAIVVGLGPGPFTGLRVGIATAQALGDALGIEVHGVGSHDATAHAFLAERAAPGDGEFLVVTDARRREVYLSVFSAQGRRIFGPEPVAPAAVGPMLEHRGLTPSVMIGAGTDLLSGCEDLAGVTRSPVGGSLSLGLAMAAARPLLTGAVPGPLTPLYLRRPDATEPGARKSVLGRV